TCSANPSLSNCTSSCGFCLGGMGCIGAEASGAENAEHDEKQQSGELRDFKWRFGLCRSHGLQGGHFVKELRNQHENIQIQGDHGRDHVDAAPGAGELT